MPEKPEGTTGNWDWATPIETRTDIWGFNPEKEVPSFFDINEWTSIPKIHPWIIKTEEGEFTIGYMRQYLSRYSNVEGCSYHVFFADKPSLLAWRVISENPQDGWLALEGEDGIWRRSLWGIDMDLGIRVAKGTANARSVSVSIETKEGTLTRTFNSNGATP